jgi:hypothetical protein
MFDFMNSPSPARCWVCWKGDKQSVSNQTHFNVGCPECSLEQQCISALYPEPILKSHETGLVHMFTLPNTQECSFGRVGVRRSTSERNGRYYLPILSAWLDDCIKNHSECASPNSQLPTRVLDIGTSTLDPVRLYLTTQEHGRYIALSHCWGTDGLNQVRTTRNNIDCRIQSIAKEEFPLNFLEAIQITRDLGVRYLWWVSHSLLVKLQAKCVNQDRFPLHHSRRQGRLGSRIQQNGLNLQQRIPCRWRFVCS